MVLNLHSLLPTQGHNEGEKWAQLPGRRITIGSAESPSNVTSTFFKTVHLLPKDLRFEHGGAKLASCPGRHLTSSRPFTHFRSRLNLINRNWKICIAIVVHEYRISFGIIYTFNLLAGNQCSIFLSSLLTSSKFLCLFWNIKIDIISI